MSNKRQFGKARTHLSLKSSAASLALSISRTTRLLSMVATRICKIQEAITGGSTSLGRRKRQCGQDCCHHLAVSVLSPRARIRHFSPLLVKGGVGQVLPFAQSLWHSTPGHGGEDRDAHFRGMTLPRTSLVHHISMAPD